MKNNLCQLLPDHLPIGIIVFEKSSHQCTFMNAVAKTVLEAPEDFEIETLNPKDLCPTEKKNGFQTLSIDKFRVNHFTGEVIMNKLNGSKFISAINVRHINDGTSDITLVTIQDVTIQKKVERDLVAKQEEIKNTYRELLKQNEELKDLDKAKDKFIALTTHELRTPLSAVLATADVLYHKIYDSPEQLEEFIAAIYHEGQHLLEIVNDILDFSKIQAGKMDFFIEEKDISPSCQTMFKNFENMAAQRKIKMVFNKPETPMICYFDSIRFNQIFSNITSNAVKFNKEGGEVNVWFESDDDTVEVYISDQGNGIPLEMQDKVFNEFETVGNIKTHQKGTGLGMPISKKLAMAMGGDLTFVSVIGEGTTFRIKLPRKKVLGEEFYNSRPSVSDDLAA